MDITFHIYPIYYVLLATIIIGGLSIYKVMNSTIEVDGSVVPCVFLAGISIALFSGMILSKILVQSVTYFFYVLLAVLTINQIYKSIKNKDISHILMLFLIVFFVCGTMLTKFMW